MTTDRELLEWAAKAHGGLEYVADCDAWIHVEPDGQRSAWWDPLVYDGDALRLAVKCRMDFTIVEFCGIEQVQACGPFDGFFTEDIRGDEMESVRRCIVRAAASIGQQKGE